MPDPQLQELINQLTLRKLHFSRGLLRAYELPTSGARRVLLGRLYEAVDEGIIPPDEIETLLNGLDAWGNQRVRIGVLPERIVALYRSRAEVLELVRAAHMEELFGREQIELNPPTELTPMSVEYVEDVREDGIPTRLLRIFAAKTRIVDRPAKDHREIPAGEMLVPVVAEAEGIVYKPFLREQQKAVAFAEIDLDSGAAVISTTLLRHGINYRAEFAEFYNIFDPLVPLGAVNPVMLYTAVENVKNLPHHEIRIYSRKSRSNVGGTVDFRSHSTHADLRQDAILQGAALALANTDGVHCNCRWQPQGELEEEVHTHIFAPSGEVTVLGQVTESSVRHVLRRIRELN